ncbi:hypothetical protein [uncultured Dysosmobacter sp.]|uniref:hypothetical protein n=1 Tax=uncultured Dysosmobacter sp. TaxID=2591384 RepID=UPI0026077480|nr:hypothetical protein [uncultured Dysosmobacter sp.]
MKTHLTRGNIMGTAILALLCCFVFILPALAEEAPPELIGAGVAVFAGGYMAGTAKGSRGTVRR